MWIFYHIQSSLLKTFNDITVCLKWKLHTNPHDDKKELKVFQSESILKKYFIFYSYKGNLRNKILSQINRKPVRA